MTIKKGKHSKEEGPIKSFIMGVGFFVLVFGILGAFGGEVGGGLIVATVGGVIAWLGSLIPDKNVVKW